jgi:hypothetical protein
MPAKHGIPSAAVSTARPARTTLDARDLGVGAALWESVAGEWKLIKCGCSQGYEVTDPPTEAGIYEGQIVKTLCEPVAG